MADIWSYEHSTSRRAITRSGQGRMTRAIFEGIPTSEVAGLLPANYTAFPGESGKRAAVLVQADDEPNRRRPGRSRVVLDYRPLMWDEWLEANPNHAVLLSHTGAYGERVRSLPDTTMPGHDNPIWRRALRDIYGVTNVNQPNFLNITPATSTSDLVVIEGPDPEAGTHWEVVSGTNYVTKYRAIYEVYAVVDDLDYYYYPYVSTCGCYNEVWIWNFPLFPEASAEAQWLQVGASMAPRPGAKRLYTCRFQFMLDMDGWDRPCISAEYRIETTRVPVYDAETKEKLEDQYRYISLPVPTGNTRSTQLIKPANFFNIDWMLVDSWMQD